MIKDDTKTMRNEEAACDFLNDRGGADIPGWSDDTYEQLENWIKRLRDRLQEASRIVEKYRDACKEWAKESHRRGNRDNKLFWERRVASMNCLLSDIENEILGKK